MAGKGFLESMVFSILNLLRLLSQRGEEKEEEEILACWTLECLGRLSRVPESQVPGCLCFFWRRIFLRLPFRNGENLEQEEPEDVLSQPWRTWYRSLLPRREHRSPGLNPKFHLRNHHISWSPFHPHHRWELYILSCTGLYSPRWIFKLPLYHKRHMHSSSWSNVNTSKCISNTTMV
jgi:hypothetical protein